MKKFTAILLALALFITPAAAYGAGTGPALYISSTTLADGFTYENALSYTATGRRTETFTLECTPGSGVYPIVLGCDTIYGGLTITQMIAYAETLGYNVVGAVNSDFGFWETRIPCGIVVEDGVYKSSPEDECALAFLPDGTAYVSYLPQVNITLTNDGTGESVELSHLNKTRLDGGLYLYSEYFSTVSTRTTTSGKFVRFTVDGGGDLSLAGELKLKVTEIIEGKTAVPIGADSLILTASEASGLDMSLAKFSVGDSVTLKTACSDEKLAAAKWATGCGNIIVSEGKVFQSEYWDRSITGANPRTVVGIKADGSVIYQVLDGRRSSSSGATMAELADDMISMGCVTAVNMDGGGSSAMSLRLPGSERCAVVNTPSDGALRAVCTYILFVTDTKPDGAAGRLFLKENGLFVLSGSTIDLTPLATDAGLHTAAVPTGVTVSAQRGTVSGLSYTAGAPGKDVLTLKSSSASGEAAIHVVSKPESIVVSDKRSGAAVSSLSLSRGDTVSLTASARYYLRRLNADAEAFKWSVTGDIGTITENGVFTADGASSAAGSIICECAGTRVEIPVALGFEFSDMRGHWAAEYVAALYEKGVVNGTGDGTTFSPDAGMKRRDFMVMLHRAAGSPTPTAESPFTDVPAGEYYTEAVAWAAETGVAQGGGEGLFSPDATLTREAGFTFLRRALPLLNVTVPTGDPAALERFTDAAALSDWARDAVISLVAMQIVEGSGTELNPKATLTRAQMAKLLAAGVVR